MRLKRRKDRKETSSASLTIGIDLKEVAGQAQAFLKEPLDKYSALVDQYEKYLTPGTLLKTELADKLDGMLEDALAGKPELKRLALSLTGDVDEMEASIIERDRLDSTRETSPLAVDPAAVTLDTSGLSIDEVVAAVVAEVEARSVGGGR